MFYADGAYINFTLNMRCKLGKHNAFNHHLLNSRIVMHEYRCPSPLFAVKSGEGGREDQEESGSP